jgi:hypothetical protein
VLGAATALLTCLQAIFVFGDTEDPGEKRRAPKRRKVSGKATVPASSLADEPRFVALFNGLEKQECVRAREELFHTAWSSASEHVQVCS